MLIPETVFVSIFGSLTLSGPEDHVRFDEPWQAHVFVIARALADRGLYSLSEWSDMLGARLRARPADDGHAYYEAVLEAVEALIISKGAASADELAKLKHAWEDAYEHTPHGKPVELKFSL
jgi:nitrile hydratase accessory protein